MSQLLPSQRLTIGDYEPVEQGLLKFITDLLFRPLAQIWREEVGQKMSYENSSAEGDRKTLIKAMRTGRLQYSVDARGRGVFSGESSATLGRALRAMGATFDARDRVYRLKPEQVPSEVLAAGRAHTAACERAHQRMQEFLRGVQGRLDSTVSSLTPQDFNAEKMTNKVTGGFKDGVKRVSIPFAEPDHNQRAQLAANYTHNMKRWVKKWANDDIIKLRKEVEANVRSGARSSTLSKRISGRYEVAKSKADFLARQETGLFMAQYHKEQYISVGVPRYVWRTSDDCDVRDTPNGGHRALQGKVFSWHEGAPAKYMSCGENSNPHEDYNCRCVASPLVDTDYNAKFKVGDKYVAKK